MKVKLIYQVSKGSFVGGLQVSIRNTAADTVAVIDTITCRNPDQIIGESKFYQLFESDDPIVSLDQHARMLFPTTTFGYDPSDLKLMEYETNKTPEESQW